MLQKCHQMFLPAGGAHDRIANRCCGIVFKSPRQFADDLLNFVKISSVACCKNIAFVACVFILLYIADILRAEERNDFSAINNIELSTEFVPVEDKNFLLRVMADMSEANFKKIKTWTGEYVINESVFQGDSDQERAENGVSIVKFPRKTKISLKFYIDMLTEKKFLEYREDEKIKQSGVSQDKDVSHLHYISILSPECFINFQPNIFFAEFEQFSDLQQDVGKVVFVEELKNSFPFRESVVTDPINLYRVGPRFVWEELRAYIRFMEQEADIQKQGMSLSVDVQRSVNQPSIVKVVLVTETANEKVTRTIFLDGSNEYNMIKFYDEIMDKQHSNLISCHVISMLRYEVSNGMAIPVAVRLNYPNRIGKPDVFSRIYSLSDTSLNKPLNKDIFTIKNLNLSDGDRVFDKIANTLQVVDKGKLVNMRVKNSLYNAPQSFSLQRCVLIIIGGILICIGLLRMWMKSKVTS